SVPDLKSWCRGEGIDPDYAIIVSGIPEEADVSKIEETIIGLNKQCSWLRKVIEKEIKDIGEFARTSLGDYPSGKVYKLRSISKRVSCSY
uniref:Paraneoplastic antigen Ma-like N-terminal domain-containing protein n=1 Tax=Sinocyclocheilus anshuiensis TaxID=1608454 RepID=A0A671SI69_9TELE